MCDKCCIMFAEQNLYKEEVVGKSVLEVGSRDVNGSVRPFIETLNPLKYIGVDIIEGPKVDQICAAEDILNEFGEESFDIVVSTEMLEHVKDWKKVINNFKDILKPQGIVIITTRSKGFPIHGYPEDYWRFEVADMANIFSDCVIYKIEKDLCSVAGVFIKVKKPLNFQKHDLSNYEVFSVEQKK